MKEDLVKIENEVDDIFSDNDSDILSIVDKLRIYELEGKKLKILKKEEATWQHTKVELCG